jgi:leader peptidase (prepilin peptidase) / N-methyltransferase
MGLGDAKLMLGIGWMLGPVFSLSSVFISFWIGGIASIFIILFSSKKVGLKTEVPFAPFLILGALLVFLFNIDIFSWQIFALF